MRPHAMEGPVNSECATTDFLAPRLEHYATDSISHPLLPIILPGALEI